VPANPERVQAVFIAAVENESPADRAAVLDRECGADDELRARVETLLKAHDAPGSFLESRAPEMAKTVDAPAPAERAGAVIGPYKLIEQIGEGGMGTVWMAQQTEPVKRLVAVKLIKAGMDSKQVIARFEAERQALALMDHPNIARVMDAGTTDGSRPYFVMDLVKGVPITKYCDEHHLTPRQRLELFIPVCQAIQHAHQKGIIHRDLKPSNVLVALYDGRPVPKVIDFGVAKAAGQQLTDKTLVTGFGAIVGTLEYMSPEQAEVNQIDIDTRSDIYSLGVLLYELLTGSPPFTKKELEKAGMLEMLRVIREQEPSKPSTKLSTAEGLPTLAANRGTEPAKLTKLVRGELDWIVMKALEKDRNRRYETANGFAMDIQRYLADEAVQACPPSVGYRFRKFARRNKGSLAVAALVLFFLVLLGSGVGWAVRDRAARRTHVTTQVELILADVDRLAGEQKWLEALAAARRAEAVLAGGEADVATTQRVRQRLKDLEFFDQPEQTAPAYTYLGLALRAQKKLPEAIGCFRRAIELDPKYAPAYSNLGDALGNQQNLDEAIVAYRKAIELDPNIDVVYSTLGHTMAKQGNLNEAMAFYPQAIKLNPKYSKAYTVLGDQLIIQRRWEESIACFRMVMELSPLGSLSRLQLHSRIVDLLNDQAWWLVAGVDPKSRDPKRAFDLLKEAAAVAGNNTQDQKTLGVAHYRAGNWRDAELILEKLRRFNPFYYYNDSVIVFYLSMAHWRLNEKEKARTFYDQAASWRMGIGATDEELRRLGAEAADLLGLEVPPTLKEPTPGPTLLKPAAGATLENSAPGASNSYVWEFNWAKVPGATKYHLCMMPKPKALSISNPLLTSTSYRYEANGYIADHNRMGWRWKVRALVNGVWTDWSEERTFDVSPVGENKAPSPKK
jgi:serine/threonine protein kinase/tetratricopeptide (TPR) repeat protein